MIYQITFTFKLKRLNWIFLFVVLLIFTKSTYAQATANDSMLRVVKDQTGEKRINTLINLSQQYYIARDSRAMVTASEALKLSKTLDYKEGVGKSMLFLGLSWADVEPDTALHFYLKSSQILAPLNHTWAHFGYKNAADIYISKGCYPEALECVLKVFEITRDNENTLQMIELLMEKAEKDRIVNEKIEAEHSASQARKWFWGVLLGLVILSHVGLVIFLRLRRRALNEKNQAIIKEQERGLAAIIQAQENERKKIAKDLHDSVGQQISAISMNFQAFTRKIAKDIPHLVNETEKIKRMILDTSEEIRSISHQMMPRALTQLGLVDAMEDIVEISFKNSSIQAEFKVSKMDERLPHEVETGIYRIVQELISNVIKHSCASLVIIDLSRINNIIVLTVKDDGIGIKQSDNKGIGLTNITSRVNALNGNFTIEAMPGKGTLATVKITI